MEEAEGNINKYIPFALIYFFCNSLFLPEGLLYTTLLTPLFLYELIKESKLNLLIYLISLKYLNRCNILNFKSNPRNFEYHGHQV